MSSNQEVTIPLTYWVDNEQKRVVMAEANGHFVDVLFSVLTLPLGTIIRHGSEIGCMNKLYKSVEDLGTDVFLSDICKRMLLSPRKPLESSWERLKLKVEEAPPTKYFMCHRCSRGRVSDLLLSTFEGAKCHCGKSMEENIELHVESKEEPAGEDNGVFVKGDAMFLIFDDLRVLRSSPSDSVQPPLKLGHKDFSRMEQMSRDVGIGEIFSILKQALISKYPLSDVFVPNREFEPSSSFSPDISPSLWKGSVEIKVIVSKSKNKIVFAEADGDFVDFLFSFLTTPLGSILNLMNHKLSLGSIHNLYTSVKNLNPSWFIESSNKSLLNPKVAPQFGCKRNPLNYWQEEDTPKYWYGTAVMKDNTERMMISKRKDMLRDPLAEVKLFDPRSSDGEREAGVGFVKRPCLFVVKDDLEVIPMTTSSSITYLEGQNLQSDDVEEHWVKIRMPHEALNLLRASLTSKEDVLTRSLFYHLKRWKRQRCIPFCGVLLGWKTKRHPKKENEEKEGEIEIISGMTRKRERDKKVNQKGDGRENNHTIKR